MITFILIIAVIVYAAEFMLLRIGLVTSCQIKKQSGYEPTVSIIVAARNEEQYIEQCVTTLSQLDYPKEKLEIIVINDHSTDRTAELIAPFTQLHSHITMLTTKHQEGNLRGKTNAVELGIKASVGEVLMFTDADCSVPKQWVRETVECFDTSTGIVGGFTLLEANTTFEGMQALDWIFLFGLASSTAGWKIPLTAIGNNLSVRRSAYDATGGFAKIPFSVTEDYALVQAIVRTTDFEVRFSINPSSVVRSNPCRTWHQLFSQKQRWGVGGLDMVLPGMLIMSIGWFVNLMLVIGLFSSPFTLWALACLCKSCMDVIFLWKPLKRLRALSLLKHFLVFEFYFTLYVIVIPFIAILSKKIVWKERTL